MSFVKEFKEFAMKGNVLDLAVGVIIGGAFGSIVKSMVDDVIMPIVGRFMGGVSFTNLYLNFSDTEYESIVEAKKAGAAILPYGNFIQNVVNFLIVAFCVFMIIKLVNAASKPKPAAPAAPAPTPEDIQLLREIRDSLKK
ncbi:MAG: large conductance mechanosensitive channel protein MscL [Bdellovibrionota bacterium]